MEENGAWLTRLPSNFDGTVLTREEWHDNVSIRYGYKVAVVCCANRSVDLKHVENIFLY